MRGIVHFTENCADHRRRNSSDTCSVASSAVSLVTTDSQSDYRCSDVCNEVSQPVAIVTPKVRAAKTIELLNTQDFSGNICLGSFFRFLFLFAQAYIFFNYWHILTSPSVLVQGS